MKLMTLAVLGLDNTDFTFTMFYDFKVLEEFEHHLSYDSQRIGHEAGEWFERYFGGRFQIDVRAESA
ncbi:MAG: hypothetical protein E6K84_02225 [Thaumarchaeota archaeon]|nr:MAG: hypothetical protein E6K84_02225 [Nitrososphaerota archaeon]